MRKISKKGEHFVRKITPFFRLFFQVPFEQTRAKRQDFKGVKICGKLVEWIEWVAVLAELGGSRTLKQLRLKSISF